MGTDRNFGVRWDGLFLAEKDGEYVFILSVDARVYWVLDGQDFVADKKNFYYPIQRSVVRRMLSPGWHELLVEYADDSGNSKCRPRYVAPNTRIPEGEKVQRDDSGLAIPPRLYSHLRRQGSRRPPQTLTGFPLFSRVRPTEALP